MENQLTIKMPRAIGSNTPETTIDLSNVYSALGRIEEIGMLTPTKAPELMTVFNKAYLVLGRYQNVVLLEQNKAKTSLNKIKSVLITEKIPELLKDKNLKNTKSNIDALCELDSDYSKAYEIVQKLDALQELMKHHLKSLEMAYTASKKMLGEHNPNLIDYRRELNGAEKANESLESYLEGYE